MHCNIVLISACSVYKNSARQKGGGFYFDDSFKIVILKATFQNNTAIKGACIYAIRMNYLTIQHSIQKDNLVTSEGGIYIDNENVKMKSQTSIIASMFKNNNAVFDGAALSIKMVQYFYLDSVKFGGISQISISSSVVSLKVDTLYASNVKITNITAGIAQI